MGKRGTPRSRVCVTWASYLTSLSLFQEFRERECTRKCLPPWESVNILLWCFSAWHFVGGVCEGGHPNTTITYRTPSAHTPQFSAWGQEGVMSVDVTLSSTSLGQRLQRRKQLGSGRGLFAGRAARGKRGSVIARP